MATPLPTPLKRITTAKIPTLAVVAPDVTLTTEYVRNMDRVVGWRKAVFWLWLKVTVFLDTRIKIPVIIHHDKEGYFRIDYCGVFSTREHAIAAAAARKTQRNGNGKHSKFLWQDLPFGRMLGDRSTRYLDAGIVDPSGRCALTGEQCNAVPADVLEMVRLSTQAVTAARTLKQSLR